MIICATGHRIIPNERVCFDAIGEYLIAQKPARVIIGCAKGFDTLVGYSCVALGIPFAMFLPFPESYYDPKLRTQTDHFQLINERYYDGVFLQRDRMMVDNSAAVIAWWDGRNKGGTAYTVRYAQGKNKVVDNLYKG